MVKDVTKTYNQIEPTIFAIGEFLKESTFLVHFVYSHLQ